MDKQYFKSLFCFWIWFLTKYHCIPFDQAENYSTSLITLKYLDIGTNMFMVEPERSLVIFWKKKNNIFQISNHSRDPILILPFFSHPEISISWLTGRGFPDDLHGDLILLLWDRDELIMFQQPVIVLLIHFTYKQSDLQCTGSDVSWDPIKSALVGKKSLQNFNQKLSKV